MINCGVQCMTCDYPIHYDTYSGCSHACLYCCANNKTTIRHIKPLNNIKSLKDFINGKRNLETKWCDWNIPIHWGANSDPFQSCEKEHKRSFEVLKLFADTKYPFLVSTKNPVLATEEPYLSLLKECNVVFQISMACSKHDRLEQGAPTYLERLKAAKILSQNVQRVIARIQPFFIDCFNDVMEEIPHYAEAGIYGVIIEGYVSKKKQRGMQKDGAYYRFPVEVLAPYFIKIRDKCHEYGVKFFCGEDGLAFLGDSLTCCGTLGLEDFKPNTYNLPHLAYEGYIEPTEAMKDKTTSRPFRTIRQSQAWELHIKGKSFADMMSEYESGYTAYCNEIKDKLNLP